jgi:N-acylneuraminate cytidylyltransferase/CMP-N,N'-diacetyllegionaminic acid synthase
MTRLCTICARGGSRGVGKKNIRDLLGKPLIVYSIIQAKSSGLFDSIAVSSDSEKILNIAKEYEVDYLIRRPDELATDQAPKIPAIRHCVKEVEKLSNCLYDVCVDLDATSPLRIIEDIRQAVNLLEKGDISNVITGAPARRSPYFNLVEVDVNGVVRLSKPLKVQIIRRQDSPKCFDLNASIYVWWRQALLENDTVFLPKTALYEMPPERSVDIDTELDFEFVKFLMTKRS